MLTRKLERCVDRALRARGGRYAEEGRVRELFVDGEGARAIVRGMVDYRVVVRRVRRAGDSGVRLEAGCTCPFMAAGPGVWGGDGEGGEVCKHVWAVIVHGEAEMLGAWEWARELDGAREVSIVAVGWDEEAPSGTSGGGVLARIAGGRVVAEDGWVTGANGVSVLCVRVPEGGLVGNERGGESGPGPHKRWGRNGRGGA